MTKLELGPYQIEGGMRFVEDASHIQEAFERDVTIYVNGFCRSCQVHRAIDNDVPVKNLRFWHQRIEAVQLLVKDVGPLHEIHIVLQLTFESDDQKNLLPLDGKTASEMARAAVYSFLASYETFYG